MNSSDTAKLLRECDAGTKMAISSVDEVLEKVTDSNLKQLLSESKNHHKKLEQEIETLLCKCNADEKEPHPMAKSMSWMKTNMKLSMDNSDATVADLITDGCNMGIKSLYRYKNQYKDADKDSVKICDRLIDIEDELRKNLRKYL